VEDEGEATPGPTPTPTPTPLAPPTATPAPPTLVFDLADSASDPRCEERPASCERCFKALYQDQQGEDELVGTLRLVGSGALEVSLAVDDVVFHLAAGQTAEFTLQAGEEREIYVYAQAEPPGEETWREGWLRITAAGGQVIEVQLCVSHRLY